MHIRSNSKEQQNRLIIFSALARINAAPVKKGKKKKGYNSSDMCLHDPGADFLKVALHLFLFLLLCVESIAVCLFPKYYLILNNDCQ